jgi:energy-coupling factor transporter ATP-binding protein EcfA2
MDASTRSECLHGTRTILIQSIEDWSATFSEQQVLWLYGLAGSGKSTISTTIANLIREQGRLGAFIFFNRDVEERSRPSNVIRTLAYRLASSDARIGALVATVIETIPSISESPLSFQFTKLLIEPLSNLPTTEAPIVLILDALDECGSAEDRSSLLALLAAESFHLPSFIRILITSRAEFDIRRAFEVQPHVLMHELALASDDNVKDILSFLQSKMVEIRLKNSSLPLVHDWPGDAAILALNRRAAGLFVWASTACRFVDGHDPRRNLELILRGDVNTTAESALDVLYRTALEAAVADRWHDEYFRADFCSIMGTILVARNPISDNTIDALLSLERPSRHTISRLGCVLHWNDTELVRILHPSFAEFLSSPLRCGTWYIDTLLHNRHLAVLCLRHLGLILRRNICNLTFTSSPVHETLPEVTSYACISWIDHICMIAGHAEMIGDILEQFLLQHLVHWLEAMSVLKKSRTTIASINRLLEWVHVCGFNFTPSIDLQ